VNNELYSNKRSKCDQITKLIFTKEENLFSTINLLLGHSTKALNNLFMLVRYFLSSWPSLATTHAKVLVTIKGKEFEQYLPHMKSDMNTRNPTKLFHFHHDHCYDTKECHALEKKRYKDWSSGDSSNNV